MTAGDGDPSDEQLAARAQLNDPAAFESLVRRHKGSLYRLIRRYVGHADDAYDLVQDTFIAAWEAIHRYDSGRPFLPWLRTIALNKCRDFGRRQAFRRWIMRAYAAEPTTSQEPIEGETVGAQAALDAERLQRLDKAIAALPASYKEPLLLTTVGGLTQDAAAAQLRVTTKAVEMRLRRARRKLATMLREPEDEH